MIAPQKNDVIEFTVDGLGMDGEGVAHIDGKALFVRGALPGERVRAKVIAVRRSFDVALLERVLVPSPHRVEPFCPLFGKCGGCDLQHLSYEAQLEFKRGEVANALHKAGVDAEVSAVVPSPLRMGYRNKASLPVRRGKDGGVVIGFFARGSHRVVPLASGCPLQSAPVERFAEALVGFMAEKGWTGYDEETLSGDVRELTVRRAGGRTAVTVVATRALDLGELAQRVTGIDESAELWLNVNSGRGNAIFGPVWKRVGGCDDPAAIEGMQMKLHPGAFLQVNDGVRELLYDRAVGLVGDGYAIEAYSGAGLLSARLAKKAKRVFGVEIDVHAHRAANELIRLNRIGNFTPVLGDAAVKLDEILRSIDGSERGKTFVVLDPPRAGISENVRQALLASGAENIAYISCNPATLARDLATLTGCPTTNSTNSTNTPYSTDYTNPTCPTNSTNTPYSTDHPTRTGSASSTNSTDRTNSTDCTDPATLADSTTHTDDRPTHHSYRIISVTPFDMFPQTSNVETLVVLSHKNPDGHIGVKVEFGEEEGQISLKEVEKRAEERKPKEKVTYKMIQDYIEKTYGFKVHTAYIAEVKRELGLPMYDAPNAVEELKRPRSHPSPQVVEAIKETLKHFEII